MPTVFKIDSIKIDVYSREHHPPHFHAIYAENEILIEIKTLQTYAGFLPNAQYRLVYDWASQVNVQSFLLQTFQSLNPHLR